MPKAPQPLKLVTRPSGEVVKVVMREEDAAALRDEEDMFLREEEVDEQWVPAPENDDDWEGYWHSGDETGAFGVPLSAAEDARGENAPKRTFDFMN